MRAVIQRVKHASVSVGGEVVGRIGQGYLALVGSEEGDTEADRKYVEDKIFGLRIFEDEAGKMNRSIEDVRGSILLVSQFTLLGDARHGRRPSFSRAARPEAAEPMLGEMADNLRARGIRVETGRFGADMEVSLLNDGPVTLLLDSRKGF
ncbi:MAG: D-aminoacyl-tRNA deacylase [Eubacteriales bacterium]|nr:D-aminoacyl-tRNA deacylase [Christensenellaceae bacterium]MEA5066768.1 D-aminoacyl-tRNA deacylase [Eubacteriales bacterium]